MSFEDALAVMNVYREGEIDDARNAVAAEAVRMRHREDSPPASRNTRRRMDVATREEGELSPNDDAGFVGMQSMF